MKRVLLTAAGVLALAGVAAGLVAVIWLVPEAIAPNGADITNQQQFENVDAARRTVAQIVGGLVVLIVGALTAYFTLRRVNALEDQVTLARDQMAVAQEGQITERLTRAIDQLGASESGRPTVEIRTGGIRSLERLASESPRDRRAILDILMAYLREHNPVIEGPANDNDVDWPRRRMDVGAVIGVLERLWPRLTDDGESADTPVLDLSQTDLRRLQFSKASLAGANLREANLSRANLEGAYLGEAIFGFHNFAAAADLRGANFSGAILSRANFTGADLVESDLSGALLWETKLSRARLQRANLGRASLRGADLSWAGLEGANLTGAFLDAADLRGAKLTRADLTEARLVDTNLSGAELVRAKLGSHSSSIGPTLRGANLTEANLAYAHISGADLTGANLAGAELEHVVLERIIYNDQTRWPDGFEPPPSVV